MNIKDNIDYRFKILYTVSIIMVVAGHCNGGGISLFADWFPYWGLHLSIFVFCSGYFYNESSEENVLKYIAKKIKRLIVPLYLYNLVYAVIVKLISMKGFTIGGEVTISKLLLLPITNGHQFVFNMGGWFVIPLFMIEIYNILVRKLIKIFKIQMPEVIYLIVNFILGMLGIYLASIGYRNGWWLVLVRMIFFLPFYSMGFFYKRKLEKYDKISGIWYFSFIFLAKLLIVFFYEKMPVYINAWCEDFVDGPMIPYIAAILGIAFWLRIATILEPVIGRNKYVNLIADNTYTIMINQFLGFMVIKTIFALISRYTIYFNDFNWYEYKTNIWYYYLPKGFSYFYIIYLVGGVIIPIFIQKCINWLKKVFVKLYSCKKNPI